MTTQASPQRQSRPRSTATQPKLTLKTAPPQTALSSHGHSALVTLLIEKGLVTKNTPVLEHATEEDVKGKHVFGALPIRLAALADRITEVPLFVPAELRGTELSLEQVRELAGTPKTYKISEV